MFFILSKVLDFLLSPLIWIIIIFLISIFVKSPQLRKRFFYTGFIVLIFFSNPFLINEAFLAWERKPVAVAKKYDAAIVLTGFTGARKSLPGRVFFGKGADRLLHTVELYKTGQIDKIIISGGSGSLTDRRISEASQVRKAFLYCGIPDSAIISEGRSSNTVENARLTGKLIDSLNIKGNFLLITSAFHMRRAEGCFSKASVLFDSYPVDVYSMDRGYTPDNLFIPSEGALEKWAVLIHEIAGYLVYWIMGYL